MKRTLPVIVISQFLCTSLWFAGSAVIGDISQQLHLEPSYTGYLASAVQFGFIIGTLIFALLSIADRFSPSLVFFTCAILAAAVNLGIAISGINALGIIFCRLLTGFFLAGIYPVGMKIASDHYEQGLGRSLGFLLGALVLGTAFPHLLKSLTTGLPWKYVIFATSFLSLTGGCLIYSIVPDGPFRQHGAELSLTGFLKGFHNPRFRAVAFGYFGHQWEIYSFWVFVPLMLKTYNHHYPQAQLNVPFTSFAIIAAGSLACVSSGLLSRYFEAKKIAFISLLLSGICCVLSPLILLCGSVTVFILFLFTWGMVVVADSPLFSALIAQNAPAGAKGTSLTIVNCIGYSVTIMSIQLISVLRTDENAQYIYMLLAIGPVLGLTALFKNKNYSPVTAA
jgi:MFS family permease